MDKKIVIGVLAVAAVVGAVIYHRTQRSSAPNAPEYIELSLAEDLTRYPVDGGPTLLWKSNIPDKNLFLSIDPTEGKTKVAQEVANTGEYSVDALDIGPAGTYTITLSDLNRKVSDSTAIEIFYQRETLGSTESVRLGGGYHAEKTGVYHSGKKLSLKNPEIFFENPAAFTVIAYGIAFEDGSYFIHAEKFDPRALGLPASGEVKALYDYISVLFAYGDTVIWLDEKTQDFTLIGDLKTFRFIPQTNNTYFVTNNTVYYVGDYQLTALKGLDAATLEFAGNCAQVEIYWSFYVKDKFSVSIAGEVISHNPQNFVVYKVESDPRSTEVPAAYGYAKDSQKVFYGCTKEIAGADAPSFQYLGKGYAKDIKNVYYLGQILPGTNPATFVAP